jgi:hypothetical protein
LKQKLVSIEKSKSLHCGFDLCPKKYKYLANPQLLEKIFSNSSLGNKKIVQVKRPRGLDAEDSMYITNCVGCNGVFLLSVENPLCIDCRRII